MSGFSSQLLIEFFGAFLGFLFAALLQRLLDSHEQQVKNEKVLNSIIDELRDLSLSLKEYKEKKLPLQHRISTPNWDALVHSGIVLELIGKPYYDTLIKAYAMIADHNEKHSLETEDELIDNTGKLYEQINIALNRIPQKKQKDSRRVGSE